MVGGDKGAGKGLRDWCHRCREDATVEDDGGEQGSIRRDDATVQ